MMKPRYSGALSKPFWKAMHRLCKTNKIRWAGCYELGCALQDLEGRVLASLARAEQEAGLKKRGGK